MNQMLDLILNRRSIRKYQDRPVPKALVKDLLRAAMSAPSAANQQPWHFIVIEDRDALNQLATIHSGMQALKTSPLTILVCGEPQATKLKFYWEEDCAAATENILLAAQASGLGAVWLGIHPDGGADSDIVRKVLNIPDHIKPFALVSIGYPDEIHELSNRYNESRVHENSKW